MKPFEYGQLYIGKSFPKRIGTLTPPNPKIFRYTQIAGCNRVRVIAISTNNTLAQSLKEANFVTKKRLPFLL